MERDESAELLALQRIDETCTKLQQQGNYLEALECMERGLVLRQHFFGAESDEVWRACKTVGEMCNLLAMTYLQQEDFAMVLELLKKAEILTERDPSCRAEDFAMVLELLKKAEILTERDPPGRAVTFNNLACYYRRQGKLHVALQYLQKALKIESRIERGVQNPADTHLNCCAVLSQLGRHQSALEHAQSALILLQEELFRGIAPSTSTTSGPSASGPLGLTQAVSNSNSNPPKADRIAVLAIAYHNIGVEQEFLKKFEQSLGSYRKGVEIADRYLGPNHAITVTLRNSSIAAKRAIINKGDVKAVLGAKGQPSNSKVGHATTSNTTTATNSTASASISSSTTSRAALSETSKRAVATTRAHKAGGGSRSPSPPKRKGPPSSPQRHSAAIA